MSGSSSSQPVHRTEKVASARQWQRRRRCDDVVVLGQCHFGPIHFCVVFVLCCVVGMCASLRRGVGDGGQARASVNQKTSNQEQPEMHGNTRWCRAGSFQSREPVRPGEVSRRAESSSRINMPCQPTHVHFTACLTALFALSSSLFSA